MGWIEKAWAVAALVGALALAACNGQSQLVGDDGSTVGGSGGGGGAHDDNRAGSAHTDSAPLGAVCWQTVEHEAYFRGFSLNEVDISGSPMCSSGLCLQNHFQGRVSCPYGQESRSDASCFVQGTDVAVTGRVSPQLASRQAAVASICSCRCAGTGPGPYCTCTAGMECVHVFDDLGLGTDDVSGSYCIPSGSAYDATSAQVACNLPLLNCGAPDPY